MFAMCPFLGCLEPGQASRRSGAEEIAPPAATMSVLTELSRIRCLSIIAHIDHGKSTLADRLLEMTGAVDSRDMRAQYLDSMDLERERGITIKAQNVRLEWNGYVINLIDTPGHVDFGYEVSRSLAACEGVILLVDASQGIEAQTLANCYQALEHDLTVVAALNKIDLPAAEPEKRAEEIEHVLGIPASEVLHISAKTGAGVAELLDAVIERIPAPTGDADAELQALMFDSYYDAYRGVISSVRVFNGVLRSGAKLRYVNARQDHDAEEIGVRLPVMTPVATLGPGEVGYLVAGHQGRRRGEGRRDRHRVGPARRTARGLPRSEADGVLRPLSRRRRRVRRPARRDGEAAAQRLVVHVRTGDVGRARLRVPLRLPRPVAHGDHPRAARARVQPLARRDRAQRRVPGAAPRREHRGRRQPVVDAAARTDRSDRRAVRAASRSSRPPTTSAR